MAKAVVDKKRLLRMLKDGKSVKECAEYFHVSMAAISKLKKQLNADVAKCVALENAHRIIQQKLNITQQLQEINEECKNMLKIETEPEIRLKILSEIRQQVRLWFDIFKSLYDMKAVQEFQVTVLGAIGGAAPEVRQAIVQELKERNALRNATDWL